MARIREIAERDVPQSIEILVHSDPWASKGYSHDELRRLIESAVGRGDTFIAEEDSAPTGIACFVPDPVIADGGCVRFIAVRQDKRRHGIGRQLMGLSNGKCSAGVRTYSYGSAPATNRPAVSSSGFGYQKVGEVAGWVGRGAVGMDSAEVSSSKKDYPRR